MAETRDVVERLRNLDYDAGGVISSVLDRAHRDVLSEAADEIEALRAEVERLRVSLGMSIGEDEDEVRDRLKRRARDDVFRASP